MRKFLTQRIFHRIYFQSFLQNAKLIAFIYGIFSGFERGLLYAIFMILNDYRQNIRFVHYFLFFLECSLLFVISCSENTNSKSFVCVNRTDLGGKAERPLTGDALS